MVRYVNIGNIVVPDYDLILEGRGCYTHRDIECITKAKKQFIKRLRIKGNSVDYNYIDSIKK